MLFTVGKIIKINIYIKGTVRPCTLGKPESGIDEQT